MLVYLILSQRSLRLSSVLFSLFTLFCFSKVVSTILSSSSQILSSASDILCVSFCGSSVSFYIFHRHRVCLVDRVDIICSVHSWWESFGSFSLTTLSLGFNCGCVSTSACGLFTGVCSWGFPGGLGFTPMRARSGGGATAWAAGVLAAPGTQGSWQLGKQQI